jgi:hypothetical protein
VALTLTAAKPQGVECYTAFLVGTQSTTAAGVGRISNYQSAAMSNGKGDIMYGSTGSGLSALPATLGTIAANSYVTYAGLF